MLEARDIQFSYHRPVLENVSFRLSPGQLVGLIGPNGSGKTTLLRILRHRLRIDHGEVSFKGKPIQTYSRQELARAIGYVLQDHQTGFQLSVLNYVLQGRFAYTEGQMFESRHDIEMAERALQVTNASGFLHREVDELSGGERQRVILARALAGEPEVLLLDEPTANMDIAYQLEMLALIKRLTERRGLLSVFVTHELNLAAEFADRILLLRGGELLADGPPGEVFRGPMLEAGFGCQFIVDSNPSSGAPRVTVSAAPSRGNEKVKEGE